MALSPSEQPSSSTFSTTSSSFLMGDQGHFHDDPDMTFDLSKLLLSVGLSALALAAVGINSLVITAILVTRKLRSPANYLICSLALTDLLVAALVMPVSIVYISEERWLLGGALCHLWLGVDVTCCTCSILHLAAIALDRYRAITDAVAYSQRRTTAHALRTIAAVWLLSVLVSLPPLVWRKQGDGAGVGADDLEEEVDGEVAGAGGHGGDVAQCLIEHDHVAFTVYSTFGAFYVPLLLILVLYYRIFRAARTLQTRRCSRLVNRSTVSSVVLPSPSDGDGGGSESGWEKGDGSGTLSPPTLSPTERSFSKQSNDAGDRASCIARTCNSNTKSSAPPPLRPHHPHHHHRPHRTPIARERRAALTLGLILGAFVICWLPFFLKEVIVNSCPSCSTSAAVAEALTWLGYLNSLVNPLIYTIFNQDFKKAFKKLLAFHCRH
ncbi:5-hydroxytryptamine receptor 1F [Engraulis encrasicolus]|uniref:5-hydroxytryptamine receptor 1F n=1 Tax=Engraulis encrasicolus TaxID=184585 RepID=UPI002FD07C55